MLIPQNLLIDTAEMGDTTVPLDAILHALELLISKVQFCSALIIYKQGECLGITAEDQT